MCTPHTWILQHIAPGVDNPAPQSSDLGQMLTCRRMEWQKCTSLLKSMGWVGLGSLYVLQDILFRMLLSPNHVDRPTRIWFGVQTLRFNCCLSLLMLAAVEAGAHVCLPQHIYVFEPGFCRLWASLCEAAVRRKRWCDLHEICYWLHKTSRLFHRGSLSSLSAAACLCLPWASLVQSVIVAAGTFHL